MRKAIGLSVVLCLVLAGTSYGALTQYNWVNTSTANSQWYGTAANWNQALVPSTNQDNVTIGNGGSCSLATGSYAAPTYTCGQFTVKAGSSIQGWYSGNPLGSPTTLIVDGSGGVGLTGDFYMGGSTSSYQSNIVFDVSGNYYFQVGPMIGQSSVILRGANKGFRVNDGGGYWQKRVDVYGSYTDCGSAYGQGGHIDFLNVKSTGSILGGNWGVHRLKVDAGGQLVGGNIQFIARGTFDNTSMAGGKLVLPGGVTFPGNVGMGSQYNGTVNNPLFVWKMDGGGDLMVRGSVAVGHNSSYGETWYPTTTVLDLRDNATGTLRNATILGGLSLSPGPTHSGQALGYDRNGLLKVSSTGITTIKVGGMVNFGGANDYARTSASYTFPHGSADFGNATMYVGGDWFVVRSPTRSTSDFVYQNWKAGTSRIIFDGNGTVKTQTLYADNMPFNNVIVRTKGTVTGSTYARDDMRLTGSLTVDCGTFVVNGRNVTFTGKGAGLTVKALGALNAGAAGSTLIFQGGGNDCNTADFISTADPTASVGAVQIKAGSPTFLQLLTDVRVLSLGIDNGCALVLNNHTLNLNGTLISTKTQYDQGWIYQNWGQVVPIPEPATCLLLGTGAIGLLGWMRRRRMK